jgi:mediator of RNA polymerase II transcription subunit 31
MSAIATSLPAAELAQLDELHGRDPALRFTCELEFIELLANPWYLQHLAQHKYFDDANFLRYLDYLSYWSLPAYARHVTHTHALAFLEMLRSPAFRAQLLVPAYVEQLHAQQFWHWRSYRYNRYKERHTPDDDDDANNDGGGGDTEMPVGVDAAR